MRKKEHRLYHLYSSDNVSNHNFNQYKYLESIDTDIGLVILEHTSFCETGIVFSGFHYRRITIHSKSSLRVSSVSCLVYWQETSDAGEVGVGSIVQQQFDTGGVS